MRIKKAEKINKSKKINKSMKIKKITATLLAAAAVLTLAACSGGTSGGASDGASGGTTAASANETLAAGTAETAGPTTGPAQPQAEEPEPPATEAAAREGAETETSADAEASRVLVAYFSCTGNTEPVATQAAELLGADLYEIVPEIPYTEEDLNYNDSSSRATTEQNDPDARPAISGSIEDISQYETILLGYPIWWGEAPRIISTFLESYDFSGKTIVPFCTSGSSAVGSSADNLHDLCSDSAIWMEGTRFDGAETTAEEIRQWLSDMGVG